MTATATLYPTTVASTSGSTWTNTGNAVGSGTGTVATFTTATNAAVGTIQLSGYAAHTAIGEQPATIESVVVTVNSYVGTTARWTSTQVQLYSGATAIGSAQTVTLSATTSNSQAITFTGGNCPSWAQLADLQVRYTATKNGTQSSTANLDTAGAVVNYTRAVAALTDDFVTQDSAKWTYPPGTAATGGQLVITPTTSYSEQRSQNLFTLVASSAYVEFVTATPVGTGGSLQTYWGLQTVGSANTFYFQKLGNDLNALYDVSGVGRTTAAIATYSATDHRWLRIREASGTVFWEVSANGSTWNAFASVATPFTITALQVALGAGYGGTEAAPGAAVYDNFNVAPAQLPRPTVLTQAALVRAHYW